MCGLGPRSGAAAKRWEVDPIAPGCDPGVPPAAKSSDKTPVLSVCIPSYNRRTRLLTLVDSVVASAEALGKSDVVEIVIVLDGSQDGSTEALADHVAVCTMAIRVVWQENAGLAAARNALTRNASGELMWFLDDDMLVTPAAMEGHMSWDRTLAPILCGPSDVVDDPAMRSFYEERWRTIRGGGTINEASLMSFANASAPRSIFARYQFDERFRRYGFEDYELGVRLLRGSVRVGFADAVVVAHHYQRTALESLKNTRDEGVNRVLMSRLHPYEGAFAVAKEPRRFPRLLRAMSQAGLTRTLWWLARAASVSSRLVRGKLRLAAITMSHDLARQSGIALGSREGPPQ